MKGFVMKKDEEIKKASVGIYHALPVIVRAGI